MLVDKRLFREPNEDECIVLLVLIDGEYNKKYYYYLVHPTHKVLPGDIVILPSPNLKEERLTGKVESKDIYKKSETPFPFEKMKYISRVSSNIGLRKKKNSYDTLKKISEIDNLEELIKDKMGSLYVAPTDKGHMGYCYQYWSYAKQVLLELGIDWLTPSECNPDILYD